MCKESSCTITSKAKMDVLSKNFWTEWPWLLQLDFFKLHFFSVFRALCCALSIQKRTRVSWLFIRHIKEKGGGSQGSRMLESIKRGAEIDSCCDTTIQQATNFGTDASVNQLFARSSMEVVSWQENLPFSSITWLSLFYWCTTTSEQFWFKSKQKVQKRKINDKPRQS